jgi:hypothetical protein
MDWAKAHADLFLAFALFGTALAFILRRVFGEQRSPKFLAFEQAHPRIAAVVTLLDGLFVGLGMVGGAAWQLVTGKAPPTLALKSDEVDP